MPYKDKSDQEQWRKDHPTYSRDVNLRRLYNISLQDYEDLVALQEGVCAICGTTPDPNAWRPYRRLNVDHDHKTKRVRGLLCANCNRGLGLFQDDASLLEAAALYLRKGGDEG